jgi:hypothetical protein
VEEDNHGIHGSESLICSFFVPAWILAKNKDVRISIRLQSTLNTVQVYIPILGMELIFFETQLSNESAVFFSRNLPQRARPYVRLDNDTPHQNSPPVFAGANLRKHPAGLDTTAGMAVSLKDGGIAVNTISYKIIVNGPHKISLVKRETEVTMRALGATTIDVVIGFLDPLIAKLPRPVVIDRIRPRVARTSSWVEVVCPVEELPLQNEDPGMVFPISLDKGRIAIPICWTMPYINLSKLPCLDYDKKTEMQWLIKHCSLMFSTREQAIRSAATTVISSGDVRVDFKEVIHSMMMQTTNLQGAKSKLFRLAEVGNEANHILIFISSLKLDLANRTIVLDAAMLPVSKALMQERLMQAFVETMGSQPIVQVPLTGPAWSLWNAILPVFAERCRTWAHKSQTCEYNIRNSIPPKVAEIGESPLCSCGKGKVPRDFLQDAQSPFLKDVLAKYAYRIAISPCFVLPYVESFIPDPMKNPRPTGPLGTTATAATTQNLTSSASFDLVTDMNNCGHCGKSERTLEDGTRQPLLTCKRCKMIKYCSKECQKQHWEAHKVFCNDIAQAAR